MLFMTKTLPTPDQDLNKPVSRKKVRVDRFIPSSAYEEILSFTDSQNQTQSSNQPYKNTLQKALSFSESFSAEGDPKVLMFGGSKEKPARNESMPENRKYYTAEVKILDAPMLRSSLFADPIASNGKEFLGVALANTLHLFNTNSGKSEHLIEDAGGEVSSFCFSTDSDNLMAYSTIAKSISLIEMKKGSIMRQFEKSPYSITRMFWDSSRLITGDERGRIRLFDVREKSELSREIINLGSGILGLSLATPNFVVSSSLEGKISLIDLRKGKSVFSVRRGVCRAVGWTSRRGGVITGIEHGPKGVLFEVDSLDGAVKRELSVGNDAVGLSFSDKGEVIAGVDEGLALIGDKEIVQRWKGHDDKLIGYAALGGNLIATAGDDETIRIWDIENKAEKKKSAPKRPKKALAIR